MMLEEAVGKLDILMEMSGNIVRQGEKVLEEIKEEAHLDLPSVGAD